MALNTGQKAFRNDIKSVKVSVAGDFMAPPLLHLDSNEELNINFDILEESPEYLKYRLIHCNADWQPSQLLESEYLGGFNEVSIDDFAFSSNTFTHFVNYNISLPDSRLPILRSGNYLLQVFPENEPDDIILQTRFYVAEDIVKPKGKASSKTDKGTDSYFQQLEVTANQAGLDNVNPYQDLFLTVYMNNNPESQRLIKSPGRIDSKEITYEHNPSLIFEAGNEFRRFEIVRTDYPGMKVDSVGFVDGMWNAWLQTDYSRKDKPYSFDETQHGRFKIDEYNSSEPDLGADYVMVHFSLDLPENIDGKIYVVGEFSDYAPSPSNLMHFDPVDGLYHASVPLKQGSYNYQYGVVKKSGQNFSFKEIEGNKYETLNEYLVLVYLRTPGARADRLVGSLLINTK